MSKTTWAVFLLLLAVHLLSGCTVSIASNLDPSTLCLGTSVATCQKGATK